MRIARMKAERRMTRVMMKVSSKNPGLQWKMINLLLLKEASKQRALKVREVAKATKPQSPSMFKRNASTYHLPHDLPRRSSTAQPSEGADLSMSEDGYIGPPITDDEDEDAADQEEGDEDRAEDHVTNGVHDEENDEEDEEEAVMNLIDEEAFDEEGNLIPAATPAKQSAKSKSSRQKTPKRRHRDQEADDEDVEGGEKMTVDSTPLKHRKKKKKPRKSEQVNLHAVSQEQVLVAEMEGTQMVHLKLRKRYYAEALAFIRWLDQASETLGELLGSTHKAEVLEAMEYFRVSYEYGMETAQVSCSRDLSVISSDNHRWDSRKCFTLSGLKIMHLQVKMEKSSKASVLNYWNAIEASISIQFLT
jgi:hypothetical protein